jgi:ATPase family protein associated with various cellular activities (AAA)
MWRGRPNSACRSHTVESLASRLPVSQNEQPARNGEPLVDYELTRLGNQEFEHLVQSLAVAVLGPGVSIFGSGRDGGREATFDGPVPIVTHGAQWDGYGVIQAKYRERLGTPKQDCQWLIGQLRKELDGWQEAQERRCPDYYIVATNCVLSPALDSGGIDRIEAELKRWARVLGLKGFDVWHSAKIKTLLENHGQVAAKYAAWITSSDILATIKDLMVADNESAKQSMDALANTFPLREFINQRFVNLDQAGRADDQRTRLAQVFVDVPASEGQGYDPRDSEIVKTIINICDRQIVHDDIGNQQDETLRPKGRVVIVGGPGQGKTTVSQFLCQLYRAEFVRNSGSASPEVIEDLNYLDRQLSSENVPRPSARRWPIQIPLNSLADSLAAGDVHGVLDYIAQRVSKRTETMVRSAQCRKWLSCYPWLVIFDGLDEVPSTSNRSQLMTTIEEFLSDVHSGNSDVVVVATTRPQGYREEFSPKHYRHFTLSPLPIATALRYGNRLIELRIGDDRDRIDLVASRLFEASQNGATARLMESPLQVTILTLLISRMGQAPEQRFALFEEYYRVIYQRELEKGGPIANLLRNHRKNVDAIHHRVGVSLQIMGEEKGETSARMRADEFRMIVRDQLSAEEFPDDRLAELTEDIVTAATDRLVFLVAPQSDLIGFEIRSLQEYCAAQGITSGSDEEIRERLQKLAASAYWRNVFSFACGKIFSDRQHLRDSVLVICEDLNTNDTESVALGRVTLAGSRLALDLLFDFVATDGTPKYQRRLAARAAEVLRILPSDAQRKLARVSPDALEYIRPVVDEYLARPSAVDRLGCISFLSELAMKGDNSAADRLRGYYEDGTSEDRDYYLKLGLHTMSPILLNVASQEFLRMDPVQAREYLVNMRWRHVVRREWKNTSSVGMIPWLDQLIELLLSNTRNARQLSTSYAFGSGNLHLSVQSISNDDEDHAWGHLKNVPVHDTYWSWVPAVLHFTSSPNRDTLADSLDALKSAPPIAVPVHLTFPWPLGSAISEFEDLGVAAQAARSGELGDIDAWLEFERQWPKGNDLSNLVNFPLGVALSSVSIIHLRGSGQGDDNRFALAKLLSDYRSMPDSRRRSYLAQAILMILAMDVEAPTGGLVGHILPDEVADIAVDASRTGPVPVAWVYGISDFELWAESLAKVGMLPKLSPFPGGHLYGASRLEDRATVVGGLIDIWNSAPYRTGLGRLAFVLMSDSVERHDVRQINIPKIEPFYVGACFDAYLGQLEGWDSEELACLLQSKEAVSLFPGVNSTCYAERPDLDIAMLRRFGEHQWHIAAALQESIAESQGSAVTGIGQMFGR